MITFSDNGEFLVVGCMGCFSVPLLLLGMMLVFLRAAEGAAAGFELPRERWLAAVTVGTLSGWAVLSFFLVGPMAAASADYLAVDGICFLPSLPAGPLLGCLLAYRAARMLGVWLCWRRCEECGIRFRFQSVGKWCPQCDAARDGPPWTGLSPNCRPGWGRASDCQAVEQIATTRRAGSRQRPEGWNVGPVAFRG